MLKEFKDISIQKAAPYLEESKKAALSNIFEKCFEKAGVSWEVIPYRNGKFIIGRKTAKQDEGDQKNLNSIRGTGKVS
ncbi:MAG: hypothetical protein DRO36_04615 [Candidatus Hecatellales archaeon]|nr:MAG: hypothetical protein DRO36_04615 [Candidatus Hecatellales archaeon]